jgi:HAD superfamily hydrolase (TIGR01490 family)
MSKLFAVFDIDGTLIRWQLFHAIVHSLGKRGYMPAAAHEHIRKARLDWKIRATDEGFATYEAVLIHEYRAALKQMSTEDYATIVQDVFDEYKDQTYTYTRNLIRRLKGEGYMLLAISGSHQEVIQKLAAYHGFDDAVGASLEQIGDRFSGVIDTPVFDKARALKQLIAKHGLSTQGSIAVGDSPSDAPMLEMVEHPLVFNPDKKMFTIARDHHWPVVVERKNMIYELEPADDSYALKLDKE